MPNTPSESFTAEIGHVTGSDVAAALDAAEDHVELLDNIDNDTVQVISRRDDYRVEVHDLERYQPAPSRSKGTVRALTADGFVRAVTHRMSDPADTVVYANVDSLTLTAVLNDDHAGNAGWRDHKVAWSPQTTPEWKHWIGSRGLGSQERFAAVIEEGEADIVNPSATVMLEIAQTFQASIGAKFSKAGRIRDGRTQLKYEEEIEAKAGEGMVEIPETFTVLLRPFYGAEPVSVTCKLRYRLNRGELAIGYHITRPEEIQRDAFVQVVSSLAGIDLDNLTFVDGIPADPSASR